MNKCYIFLIVMCMPFLGYNQDLKILSLGEKIVNQKKMKLLNLVNEYGNFETNFIQDEIIHTVSTTKQPDGVFQLNIKIPLLSKNIK